MYMGTSQPAQQRLLLLRLLLVVLQLRLLLVVLLLRLVVQLVRG
jgi:hypothetical protein